MVIGGLEPGKRPALVISECQNGLTNDRYEQSPLIEQVTATGIIPKIAALADTFRHAGCRVVYATIAMPAGGKGFHVNCVLASRIHKAGRLLSGTPYAAVHDDLPVLANDVICERMHGMAAFTGTELDAVLRGHGVDTVVLCGVSTNVAIPGGATEAIGLGYEVVIARDCTAGGTAASHEMQLAMHLPLLAAVVDSSQIVAALG